MTRCRTGESQAGGERHTGKPLSRTHVDATVAARYFEFYANTIESFYGDPIPVLEDEFGSWRQPESRT
jgi:hypothetical protein